MVEKERATILTNTVIIKPDELSNFVHWQAKFNATIAKHPGFISLEILSPVGSKPQEWLIIQRFHASQDLWDWYHAEDRNELMKELFDYTKGERGIKESFSSTADTLCGITEVMITQVNRENEKAYYEWMAKIHQVEAKFPGFRRVYMQSPRQTGGVHWITLLQFDSPENLDRWLNSPERERVLEEAKPLISSLESHRMISPYAGWFSSIEKVGTEIPIWKQTMLILLVLFPIVMLELKYLSIWTFGMNMSLGTFIGNAISVSLISWPMMPIAILCLGWWLVPKSEKSLQVTIIGTIAVIFLYLIEVAIFWNY